MKNTLKTLLAVAVLGAASSVSAVAIPQSGMADISKTSYAANSGGGEFLVEVGGADAFYTFCVQRYESLTAYLDGTFYYNVSDVTSAGTDPKTVGGQALSAGTSYLYRQFLTGSLYNLADAVSRKANSIKLQRAIWTLEGEGAGLGESEANNVFLSIVYGMYGELGAKADTSDKTVKIMQIWDKRKGDLQDIIVYVPDSGSTLAFLGLGLAGFAFFRRRLA